MSLKAPYNFVPLNTTVVKPHWANYISHDLPFEDAQNGHLEIELQTHSPLFVRNGAIKTEPDTEKTRFNHHQNRYFIPGSSLKGMLRSVLEIMSFGRITDKMDDVTLSQRDFSNPKIYEKEKFAKEICCGWLKKEGDIFWLKDCGKPGRITHEALSSIARNKQTEVSISDYYRQNRNYNDKVVKSAKSKYELFFSSNTVKEYGFGQDNEAKPGGLTKYILAESGQKRGRVVCTGQPARYDPNAGKLKAKHSEFVFFTNTASFEVVDKQVIKNLKVSLFDGEKANEGIDWKWRREQLENGEEIPVFFRRNEQGNGIKDMGLSFLYKMAYDHPIKQLARQNDEGVEKAPDLADTIFGYVESQRALKGRVQIGHAFVQGHADPMTLQNDVLSGPKPTYYPNYIRQEGNGKTVSNYATYNNEHASISGWKRYPIRADGSVSQNAPQAKNGAANANVASSFVPLQAGATFRFRINYHNLRRDELGALISAITFHNTPETYHALGLAKPLGYGKISLTILKQTEEERKNYLRAFEAFMRNEVNNWHLSEQLQELVAMAKPHAIVAETSYMELAGFKEAKDNKHYLRKHSQIYELPPVFTPLLTEIEIGEKKAFYSSEKNRFKSTDPEQALRNKRDENLTQLNTIKRDWRAMIQSRKDEIKKEEEQKERSVKSQKAVEGGPDFTDVQVPHKDPLDRMNNEVRKYGTGLPGGSIPKKDKEIQQKFPKGYALEAHHAMIIDYFVYVYLSLSGRDKSVWKKADSEAWKYLRQWVGPDKANEVLKNLP